MQTPPALHLLVPELVPREFADHADNVQKDFARWTQRHDTNQLWLVETSTQVGQPVLPHNPMAFQNLATALRGLAEKLLSQATVLERDSDCLLRAVQRVIDKKRPSHEKEIKESMNLEQCLELSRQLLAAGSIPTRIWLSSNTNDFAHAANSDRLHRDLKDEFTAAGLEYFTSLRAALGQLGGRGEL